MTHWERILGKAEQIFVQELEDMYDEYHPDGMTVSELCLTRAEAQCFRDLVDETIQRIYERR